MAVRCICRSWIRSGRGLPWGMGGGEGNSLDTPACSKAPGKRDHGETCLHGTGARRHYCDPTGKRVDRCSRFDAGRQALRSGISEAHRPGCSTWGVTWPYAKRTCFPSERSRGPINEGVHMNNLSVHFEGVSKVYPHFTLDDLSLELPTGTVMGLIGANGAGKSTTIRILMGLVHQDQGQVHVLGREMPREQAVAKLDIGFVSEDMRLYGSATLAWHMKFVRSLYPQWDQSYADTLLRRFDLKPQQKMKGLALGQRVKAALLLALARRPRLLVLGDPTTGLDPVARQEVLGELMAVLVDEDRTILFSSHNTSDVEQISDQITFIDRGRIIASDDKEIFLDRWRRLRLVLSPDADLPSLPGVVEVGGSKRLPVLVTNRFDPAMVSACNDAGATVQAVDPMTLEEIFVANVHSRREKQTV